MTDLPYSFDSDRVVQEREDSGYRFDCEFCATTVQSATADGIKHHGTSHLTSHRAQLVDAYADRTKRMHCENDCGNVLVVADDRTPEFECVTCGYDNFEAVAGRYLYWRIETM